MYYIVAVGSALGSFTVLLLLAGLAWGPYEEPLVCSFPDLKNVPPRVCGKITYDLPPALFGKPL